MTYTDSHTFNAKLFTCIDLALASLGSGVKEALYYQAEVKYGVPKDQLAERPLELLRDFEEMLGSTGYAVVQKLITVEVRSSFGIQQYEGASLEQIVNEARKRFLS